MGNLTVGQICSSSENLQNKLYTNLHEAEAPFANIIILFQ